MTKNKQTKKPERSFCYEEEKLYDEIIQLLELEVHYRDNCKISYNHIPLKNGKRFLVKLCNKSMGLSEEQFVPFKPLKNHKHCQLMLDYIQENEYEDCELFINKTVNDEGKNMYSARLMSGDEELANSKINCYSDIEAKFRTLHNYFFDDKNLDKKIIKIRKFDTEYKKMVKPKKKGKRK